MTDLFAFAGVAAPLPKGASLNDAGEIVFRADPEKVRRELAALLDTARNADVMPWPENRARCWRLVFPQMANWLPADEADAMRAEFAANLQRLGLPPSTEH